MSKLDIYHQGRKLDFKLHGSKSRCSFSSRRVVLSNNGKKSVFKRLKHAFKTIGKWLQKLWAFILALSKIIDIALFIKNYFGW